MVKNILWKWCWFNQGVSHLVSSRISTLFWRSCGWRGQKSSTHWHIPHPSISYPAFSIHFTFALLQGFLEHGLVSLAAQFLLSTDTDTWWPSGCQSFRQASHTVTSSDIYGLNIKFKQSDFFMWPRTNQKTLQPNREELNRCLFKEFYCASCWNNNRENNKKAAKHEERI